MSQPKTDLNQLVIFAKVVDTRSFTAAGRALGLPKSTVSRKVAQLEQRLGVQLLLRTTRKLSLTEVGAAFYERCARIATEIDEATQAIMSMDDEPRGLVRVAAEPSFGSSLLAGIAGEFLVTYPEVDLDIHLVGGRVDLASGGFDLALAIDNELPERDDLLAAELGMVRSSLVASNEYLQRRGRPVTNDQLGEHDFVVVDRRPRIELHDHDGESVVLDHRPRLAVNDLALVHDAVLAGVGLGLLPSFCCAADIEAGRLRELDDWRAPGLSIHAYYPTSRHLATKVRTFMDFVRDQLVVRPRVPTTRTTLTPALMREQARPSA